MQSKKEKTNRKGSCKTLVDVSIGGSMEAQLTRLSHDINADQVELILLLVEIPKPEEESYASNETDDTCRAVIPYQVRVLSKGVHSFTDCRREGGGEQEESG